MIAGISSQWAIALSGLLYLVLLAVGSVIVLKRRMDRLEAAQRGEQAVRGRLEKIVHDELLPSIQMQIQGLHDIEKQLIVHTKDHVIADHTGRLTVTNDVEPTPKAIRALRDDLVSLAKELERPAGPPVGAKEAARTGARQLLRVVSPRRLPRGRRRPPPS